MRRTGMSSHLRSLKPGEPRAVGQRYISSRPGHVWGMLSCTSFLTPLSLSLHGVSGSEGPPTVSSPLYSSGQRVCAARSEPVALSMADKSCTHGQWLPTPAHL